MITEQKLMRLIKAESDAYRAYLEAHDKANNARVEFTLERLSARKIYLNQTPVYVYNWNMDRVRAKVTAITKDGKVICFPIDERGRRISKRQAACCDVDALDVSKNPLEP